ncbi:hypothetical protein Leryth_001657 [Lithospermum erythrorhizon]|nr:hypothetical protein Leryth_001657 [Lithospermum erythrorhizon]
MNMKMGVLVLFSLVLLSSLICLVSSSSSHYHMHNKKAHEPIGEQPLSKIAIHKTVPALRLHPTSVKASPLLLGVKMACDNFTKSNSCTVGEI